jgi:hygromycin-B 4-O-kinase
VDRGEVTVVLDWANALFGDPLYDLAFLDLWPSGRDLVDQYQRLCEVRGIAFENYRARVQCYKIYIGLDSLRFFAKIGNGDAYNAMVGILEGLPADVV